MEQPWKHIIGNLQTLSYGHSKFANKLSQDLINPLSAYDRTAESGSMGLLERNMSAIAKDIQAAENKVQKADTSKSKNKSAKQSEALEDSKKARARWDSEIPNSFEKLQQVDESRIAFFKDALVRFETSSIDLHSTQIKLSEASVAALLEISPTDEPMDFVSKKLSGQPSNSAGSGRPVPSLTRIASQGDSSSVRSSGGAASSLKSKFGTLLKGRRSGSPTKRQSTTSGALSASQLGRSTLPETREVLEPGETTSPATVPNGETSSRVFDAEMPASPPATAPFSQVPRENNFSAIDNATEENNQLHDLAVDIPQDVGGEATSSLQQSLRQVAIRDSAVATTSPDEDNAALDRVSSTLRSQPTVTRRSRGRRDARNTMYSSTSGEDQSDSYAVARNVLGSPLPREGEPSYSDAFPNLQSPGLGSISRVDRQSTASAFSYDGNESIRSGHSNVSKNMLNRHQEATVDGLHLSVIETVSVMLAVDNTPSNLSIIGEAAMSYQNPSDESPLNLRIQSSEAMTRLISNDHINKYLGPEQYEVPSRNLPKMEVLFRYQVNADETRSGRFIPIIMTQKWSPEANQTSVKITYRLNPAFGAGSVTLQDVEISAGIQGVANSCVAKPTGTFVKRNSKLVWRLNEVTLESSVEGSLLARFKTENISMPTGFVEVKFKTLPSNLARGSGFGIHASKLRKNPFADTPSVENVLVQSSYVLQTGRFQYSTGY